MYLQVIVFQYSFWLSLFLLFFTAASRVSLFGVIYLLLCFVFLYRGEEMLKDRQRNRHRRSVFWGTRSSVERLNNSKIIYIISGCVR